MARTSKSLLNKTSKPKKENKYSEISSIKQEYKYDLRSRVVYVGLLEDYSGLECEIVKRSRRKIIEFYVVKFDNEEIVSDISGNFLMKPEEYELYLSEKENGNDENNQNDLTEFEIELNKRGLESYKNYVQCLNSALFYNRGCDRCKYLDRCVYKNKYNYGKLKID